MIAYFYCLCRSSERLMAARLKEEGYEIRIIKNNPTHRRQAKQYGLKLPFIVEDGKARSLYA